MPFTVPLRDLARELELRKWAEGASWPREGFFRAIDSFRAGLKAIHKREPTDEQLATLVAAAIEEEDGLATHCLDGGYPIAGTSGWKERCEAAAWMTLRRYNRAVKDGKWTPDE